MPSLLRVPSPLDARFAVSLPHSLLATISLLSVAADYEGLADWLRETRASMSADLLEELCLLVGFPGGYQRLTSELVACLPDGALELSFDELLAHLRAIPVEQYQLIALRALARGTEPRPTAAELLDRLDRPADWAAFLSEIGSSTPPQVVSSLVLDAETFKRRLLGALVRFWREIYAAEYEATRPLMERSVSYHRAQRHSPYFPDLFVAVTGRLMPERIARLLSSISLATFVPSCYVGPYVAYTQFDDQLILFYNCRSTPVSDAPPEGASLYPPLKALADETRLQILALLRGRELYAQEIVDRLDISQPAVSRHLNLMASAGVLRVRRDGNTKYYAIDGKTLARLADSLLAYGQSDG